jgi:hypothetical protein
MYGLNAMLTSLPRVHMLSEKASKAIGQLLLSPLGPVSSYCETGVTQLKHESTRSKDQRKHIPIDPN